MRRRQFILRLTCVLSPLLILALLGEGVLRWQHHRFQARRHPGTSCLGLHPELIYACNPGHCGCNSRGFPAPERAAKSKGVFRIIVIGDSIAMGQGVRGFRGFPRLLKHRLERRAPGRFEVINLAITGYSTSQELLMLQLEALPLQPDLVIWSYVLNDPAHPTYHNANGELGRYFHRPPSRAAHWLARRWFLVRERLRARGCPDEYHGRLLCTYRTEIEADLGHLARLVGERRIPLLFLIHPTLHPEEYQNYPLLKEHRWLSHLAARLGFTALDLLDRYRQVQPEALIQRPEDPWHPTPLGHELVAERIIEALELRGLLTWESPPKSVELKLADLPRDRRSGWHAPLSYGGQLAREKRQREAGLALPLAPAPHGVELLIESSGGSEDQGLRRMLVKVNGWPVGQLWPRRGWDTALLQVAPRLLRPGSNWISFASAPEALSTQLVVRRVGVSPVGAAMRLPLAGASFGTELLTGFSREESGARRLEGHGSEGQLKLLLLPLEGAYNLELHGRGAAPAPGHRIRARVVLNDQPAATVDVPSAWTRIVVPVRSSLLKPGLNKLRLVLEVAGPSGADTGATGSLSLRSLALSPVELSELRFNITRPPLHVQAEGWSHPEQYKDMTVAWSNGPRSTLELGLKPRQGPYRLRAHLQGIGTIAPVRVKVEVNGQALARTISVSRRWRVHSLEIPAGLLRAGWNKISFVYHKTAVPAEEDPTSQDRRALAVYWEWLELKPATK